MTEDKIPLAPLSVQDLLIPRYKVIAEWPDMLEKFSIGYIFKHPFGRQYLTETSKYDPADFPHLFIKLEWWEDLKPIQFPKYVKWAYGGIFEVINWRSNPNTSQLDGVYTSCSFLFIHDLKPATKEEYDHCEAENKKSPIVKCTDENCDLPSIGDYNGHGAFACAYHMKKWNEYFDEEYK